jgi:ribosome-binding protein aMBF1 (putative translation factor)
MPVILPPSVFEKRDASPCELCGKEKYSNQLTTIRNHHVCADCADLIRNDLITLPPRIRKTRPLFRAVMVQSRDVLILLAFIGFVVFLVERVSKSERVHRDKPLDLLLKEQSRTNPP